MTALIKRHWGFALFLVVCAYAVLRLLHQPVPGHYRVFTRAARALTEGRNPYGTDFGTSVGDYFYSPACALYFFRPFAKLPEDPGLILYMALSLAVFALGVRKAFAVFSPAAWSNSSRERIAQVFWLGITPQVFGGILASKLEIIMAGILFLAMAWAAEKRRLILSGLLSAMITSWKFQPLPIMGLIGMAWLTGASQEPLRIRLRWPVAFVLGLFLWNGLPYLETPAGLLAQSQGTWVESFSGFVRSSYLNFENIFALLQHGFGIAVSYRDSQWLTGIAGVLLLGNLIAWIRWVHPEPAWKWVVLLAVGSGTIVMTAFSPLGQNNALILYSPLFFAALVRAGTSRRRVPWILFLAAVWIAMTFSYADLTPIVIREKLRYDAAKAGVCLILGAVWIASYWRAEWMRMLNEIGRIGLKRSVSCGLLVLGSLLALARCDSRATDDVSQDKIFPQYSLNYDDASKTVVASAAFTHGNAFGPRLVLSGQASIALDDGTQFVAHNSVPDSNVFYQAVLSPNAGGDPTRTYTFVFHDSSGGVYQNSLKFGGLIDLATSSSIESSNSISKGFTVGWTVNSPLATGEQVQIRVRPSAGPGPAVQHANSALGASAVSDTIAPGELSALAPGAAQIRVCRVTIGAPTQSAKVGGSTSVASCSGEQPIVLAP